MEGSGPIRREGGAPGDAAPDNPRYAPLFGYRDKAAGTIDRRRGGARVARLHCPVCTVPGTGSATFAGRGSGAAGSAHPGLTQVPEIVPLAVPLPEVEIRISNFSKVDVACRLFGNHLAPGAFHRLQDVRGPAVKSHPQLPEHL